MGRPIVAAVLVWALAACSAAAAHPAKPSVVVAMYPLEEIVRSLGQGAFDIVNLTPPGAEPHDLELRPSDIRHLHRAALVLTVGAGFQPSVDAAVRALPDRSSVHDVLDGIRLRRPVAGTDERYAADPHVWLSPPLMQKIVHTVSLRLMQLAPEHAESIGTQQTRFIARLAALDGRYLRELGRCARRDVFTSHAAFGYLAARYRLRQIAVTGISPEAEPSPRRLRDVARLARQRHATTIFFESLVSPRVAATVARIAGARTAVLDPIEGLTAEQRRAEDDYFSLMRANLAALRAGLGCVA